MVRNGRCRIQSPSPQRYRPSLSASVFASEEREEEKGAPSAEIAQEAARVMPCLGLWYSSKGPLIAKSLKCNGMGDGSFSVKSLEGKEVGLGAVRKIFLRSEFDNFNVT